MSHSSLRGISRRFSRAFDALAQARLGLPSIVLMENAGRGAAEHVHARFGGSVRHACCVCGPGNNGGDALVVARHLLRLGWSIDVLLAGIGSGYADGGDAAKNAAAVVALGVEPRVFGGAQPTVPLDGVVVDGLFGTGLERPLEGRARELVKWMNAAGRSIVALDLPSGLDADSGEPLGGVAVRASLTITFVAPKTGLLQSVAAPYVGSLVVTDIGVPYPLPGAGALGEGG